MDYLKQFADNEPMFEAVKANLTARFERQLLDLSYTKQVSNENLGENVRAINQARDLVETALADIARLAKKEAPKSDQPNPAR